MDLDQLARETADTVAAHLDRVGAEAADHLVRTPTDRLFQLVSAKLRESLEGNRALEALAEAPGCPAVRALTAEVLARAAGADERFATALTCGRPQWPTEVAAADPDSGRRFRLGPGRLGTGGLVTLITAGVLGTGAVYYVAARDPISIDQIVGTWTHPATLASASDSTVLTVALDGVFTLDMSLPADPENPRTCAGVVTTERDTFVFRSRAGGCGPISAVLASDGRMLDIGAATLVRRGSGHHPTEE